MKDSLRNCPKAYSHSLAALRLAALPTTRSGRKGHRVTRSDDFARKAEPSDPSLACTPGASRGRHCSASARRYRLEGRHNLCFRRACFQTSFEYASNRLTKDPAVAEQAHRWTSKTASSEKRPLLNHSFMHARLKQPRRLLRQNGTAEIRALPLAAPVPLKEVELRSRLHSYCNDSLVQTPSDTDHGADKS